MEKVKPTRSPPTRTEAKLTALAGEASGDSPSRRGDPGQPAPHTRLEAPKRSRRKHKKRNKSGPGHRGAVGLQDADVCFGSLRIFQPKLSRRSEECASPEKHRSGKKLQRARKAARFQVFFPVFLNVCSAPLISAPAANRAWSPELFQVGPFIPKPFGTDEIKSARSRKTTPKLPPLTPKRCPGTKRALE